jgi:NADH:ubiquinone oxidoreductase subunit E
MGDKKYDRKTGEVKLKAQQVMAARRDANRENFPASSCPRVPASSSTDVKAKSAKATILVCQKSDCVKRGADGVCQALQGALRDRGLADQVTIKATGCMKNCKAGPNLVMPDKTRYSRIQATQVPALMEKHFADSSVNQKQENVRKVAMPISSTATI